MKMRIRFRKAERLGVFFSSRRREVWYSFSKRKWILPQGGLVKNELEEILELIRKRKLRSLLKEDLSRSLIEECV